MRHWSGSGEVREERLKKPIKGYVNEMVATKYSWDYPIIVDFHCCWSELSLAEKWTQGNIFTSTPICHWLRTALGCVRSPPFLAYPVSKQSTLLEPGKSLRGRGPGAGRRKPWVIEEGYGGVSRAKLQGLSVNIFPNFKCTYLLCRNCTYTNLHTW